MEGEEKLPVSLFVRLIVLGLILLFAGFAALAISFLTPNGQTGFGGIIIIGPIPIIIGYGREAPWLVLFSVILTIVCITAFVLLWKREK